MRSLLLSSLCLVSAGAFAQRANLPPLNAYAACKYYVDANVLGCIRASGERGEDRYPMNVAGESPARIKSVKTSMKAVGFKVARELPGVVMFLMTAEAAD